MNGFTHKTLSSGTETELKFTFQAKLQSGDEFEKSVSHILKELKFGGYKLEESFSYSVTDEYFDTKDLQVDRDGSLIRARHLSNGDLKLTIKKSTRKSDGIFKREENEEIIDIAKYEYLKATGFISVLEKHFPVIYRNSDEPRLRLIIKINDIRDRFKMSKAGQDYIFSVDKYQGVDCRTGKKRRFTDEMLEFEIEANNEAAVQELPELSKHLKSSVPELRFSEESKYGQILSALKIRHPTLFDRFSSLTYMDKVTVISAIIGGIALVISILSLIGPVLNFIGYDISK